MPKVTKTLMFELLKQVQLQVGSVARQVDMLKWEMQAFRIDMVGLQQKISGIHSMLVRQETRLERIERRLELANISP